MKNRALLLLLVVLGVVASAYLAETRWLKKGGGPKSASGDLPVAPDFSAPSLEGKAVRLSDYRGKVVLINFWATWCGPCIHEIPWLIELQEKYRERGLVILGVSMDEEGKSVVAPWLEKQRFEVNGAPARVNYSILLGGDPVAEKFGGLIGLPTSLVISRDGRITKRFIGPASFESFAKEVEANL
jgi:thiol-disulfide isomerase/thioredoxin